MEGYLGVSETLYSKSLGGRSGRREGALDKKLGLRLHKGENLTSMIIRLENEVLYLGVSRPQYPESADCGGGRL